MTRGDLVLVVSRNFDLSTAVGSSELDALQRWANDGVVDVLIETHCYIERDTSPLTAGVANYQIDPKALATLTIEESSALGVGGWTRVSPEEIKSMRDRQPNATGPARYYAVQGSIVMVHPVPGAGESLTWYIVPNPTPMTADAHDPSVAAYGGIPTWMHRCIQAYMEWRAAKYDNVTKPLGPMDYFQMYQLECRLAKRRLRARGGTTVMRRPQTGYPGRDSSPRTNDEDVVFYG